MNDLELACSEALPSRERGTGIHITPLLLETCDGTSRKKGIEIVCNEAVQSRGRDLVSTANTSTKKRF